MADGIQIAERLARIETNLQAQSKELTKVVALLDRMVRVEEKLTNVERLEFRIAANEKELEGWKTARRVLSWIAGISATVIGGIILFKANGQ